MRLKRGDWLKIAGLGLIAILAISIVGAYYHEIPVPGVGILKFGFPWIDVGNKNYTIAWGSEVPFNKWLSMFFNETYSPNDRSSLIKLIGQKIGSGTSIEFWNPSRWFQVVPGGGGGGGILGNIQSIDPTKISQITTYINDPSKLFGWETEYKWTDSISLKPTFGKSMTMEEFATFCETYDPKLWSWVSQKYGVKNAEELQLKIDQNPKIAEEICDHAFQNGIVIGTIVTMEDGSKKYVPVYAYWPPYGSSLQQPSTVPGYSGIYWWRDAVSQWGPNMAKIALLTIGFCDDPKWAVYYSAEEGSAFGNGAHIRAYSGDKLQTGKERYIDPNIYPLGTKFFGFNTVPYRIDEVTGQILPVKGVPGQFTVPNTYAVAVTGTMLLQNKDFFRKIIGSGFWGLTPTSANKIENVEVVYVDTGQPVEKSYSSIDQMIEDVTATEQKIMTAPRNKEGKPIDENGNVIRAKEIRVTCKTPLAQGIFDGSPRMVAITPEMQSDPEVAKLLNQKITITSKDGRLSHTASFEGWLKLWGAVGVGAPVVSDDSWLKYPGLQETTIPYSAAVKMADGMNTIWNAAQKYAKSKGYNPYFYFMWHFPMPHTSDQEYFKILNQRVPFPHPGQYLKYINIAKVGEIELYTYIIDEVAFRRDFGKAMLANIDYCVAVLGVGTNTEDGMHWYDIAAMCMDDATWEQFKVEIKKRVPGFTPPEKFEELRRWIPSGPGMPVPTGGKKTYTGEEATKMAQSYGLPDIKASRFTVESEKTYDWGKITSGSIDMVSGPYPSDLGYSGIAWAQITITKPSPGGETGTWIEIKGPFGEPAVTKVGWTPTIPSPEASAASSAASAEPFLVRESGGGIETGYYTGIGLTLLKMSRPKPFSLIKPALPKISESMAKEIYLRASYAFPSSSALSRAQLRLFRLEMEPISPFGFLKVQDDLFVDNALLLLMGIGLVLMILPERKRGRKR